MRSTSRCITNAGAPPTAATTAANLLCPSSLVLAPSSHLASTISDPGAGASLSPRRPSHTPFLASHVVRIGSFGSKRAAQPPASPPEAPAISGEAGGLHLEGDSPSWFRGGRGGGGGRPMGARVSLPHLANDHATPTALFALDETWPCGRQGHAAPRAVAEVASSSFFQRGACTRARVVVEDCPADAWREPSSHRPSPASDGKSVWFVAPRHRLENRGVHMQNAGARPPDRGEEHPPPCPFVLALALAMVLSRRLAAVSNLDATCYGRVLDNVRAGSVDGAVGDVRANERPALSEAAMSGYTQLAPTPTSSPRPRRRVGGIPRGETGGEGPLSSASSWRGWRRRGKGGPGEVPGAYAVAVRGRARLRATVAS